MPFPLSMTWTMSKYLLKKRLQGRDKFPLVMMLEPLHACNLTCTGCGRIREYESTIRETIPVEQCLKAVEECGAPIVSVCGGEPMIYKPLDELVSELMNRKKFVYLCTNGMFITKRLSEFKPSPRFFFNVHIDGLEQTHDLCVERSGVFKAAVEGIKAAKAAGFMVCTNTTVYKETDMGEIEAMLDYLQTLGCDGHMISPAYSYAAVNVKEIFMDRAMISEKFRDIDRLFRRYKLNSSPIYLEFLKGERDLTCTAWGNPTYNTKGWKGPCYLITDAHHATFNQLIDDTPWENYGRGNDPRCENCMVHCGYEPSAALGVNSKLGDTFKMMSWALT
ncbi:MAG: adenosyl-hopene transferase HpnH [Acidobacteria bacterium]|nr:adenosyl-hopene transferase HpnH [Acidobacteriota bacterium]